MVVGVLCYLTSLALLLAAHPTSDLNVLAGGGGWGDPLERDPQAVLRDVRNEFLSAARAKADYGVIVDTKTWRVEGEPTKKLRAEMAAARGWREVPKVQWHEPAPLTQAAE